MQHQSKVLPNYTDKAFCATSCRQKSTDFKEAFSATSISVVGNPHQINRNQLCLFFSKRSRYLTVIKMARTRNSKKDSNPPKSNKKINKIQFNHNDIKYYTKQK